jgi:hypothetical protein
VGKRLEQVEQTVEQVQSMMAMLLKAQGIDPNTGKRLAEEESAR